MDGNEVKVEIAAPELTWVRGTVISEAHDHVVFDVDDEHLHIGKELIHDQLATFEVGLQVHIQVPCWLARRYGIIL